MHLVAALAQEESGQGMVEYSLLLAVLVVGVIVVFRNGFAAQAIRMYNRLSADISSAVSG